MHSFHDLLYLLFQIFGLKFFPKATPKNSTMETKALNINKNKIQNPDESGFFVKIDIGVIRVIK